MSPSDLQALVMIEISKGPCRAWRSNCGLAWQGEVVSRSARLLVLRNPRPIHLFPPGFGDLVGIGVGGIFCAGECKTGPNARMRPDQRAFVEMVLSLGGRAGEVRSVEDARRIWMP